MDPEANLAEQLSLAAEIIEIIDGGVDEGGNLSLSEDEMDEVVDNANRLAELVQALDGWLRSSGFLPSSWERGRKRAEERSK